MPASSAQMQETAAIGSRIQEAVKTFQGRSLIIDVIPYGDEWEAAAEVIQRQFHKYGIEASIRTESFEAWLHRVFHTYDFELSLNYVHYHLDPALSLRRMYHSSGIRKGVTFSNCTGWHCDEADELFDKARVSPKKTTRTRLYCDAAKLLLDAMPSVFIGEVSPPSYTKYVLPNRMGPYDSFSKILTEPTYSSI